MCTVNTFGFHEIIKRVTIIFNDAFFLLRFIKRGDYKWRC